jgi:PTS system mannitol-specific IIC component
MGSSAMGATTLRNKLKKMGLDIEVEHFAIDDIPKDTKLVITHESLSGRARSVVPHAEVYTITNFMDGKQYDELIKRLA